MSFGYLCFGAYQVIEDDGIMMLVRPHHDAYTLGMRTTVNLDADVAAAVERLQRERGLGLSAAVNELAREGLTARRVDFRYVHPSYDLGLQVDLTSVADTLELLDELDRADDHAS